MGEFGHLTIYVHGLLCVFINSYDHENRSTALPRINIPGISSFLSSYDHASSSSKFDGRAAFRQCPFKGDSLRKQEEVSVWFIRTFPVPVPTSPRDPAQELPHISRSAKFCFTMLLYFSFIPITLLTTFLFSYQEAITKSVYLRYLVRQYRPFFFQGCDACRARKVRCARENPDDPHQSCKHCLTLGIPCTYDYQPKKRGPPNL